MADKKRIDEATGTSTVGHEWDGIEELDTPMPRWWLWSLYATIVWAIGYVIWQPAWPLLNSATAGTSGWTSRSQLAHELEKEQQRRAPILAALSAAPLESLTPDSKLYNAAKVGGQAAFKQYCVQCHGSGAAGSKGYPNLNDDDWLWGGDLASIEYSIIHGIRNPDHDATRVSQMPNFGKDGILKPNEVNDVTAYVLSLSGTQKPSAATQRGAPLFEANCAVCHGADGKGMRSVGAPNLTDKIWLYGGKADEVAASINVAHQGVMPAWGGKLDPATIKMLAVYVHSLGGGESAPVADSAAPAMAADSAPPSAAPASGTAQPAAVPVK